MGEPTLAYLRMQFSTVLTHMFLIPMAIVWSPRAYRVAII